jgi:hypothetical protein
MTRTACNIATAFVALAVAFAGHAGAQERKAYKVVDKNGKVTYTQAAPLQTTDTRDVKKISIAPAQQGRGGFVGYVPEPGPLYSTQPYYAQATAQQKAAQDQRVATLRAECERARNTDCNNPSTLQYIDSTKIPRRGF